MANLFFIHTPMQLFMAQQIIHQERLKDNVMVYDYAGNNKHYIDAYKFIFISEMWSKRVINPVRLGWNMIKGNGLIKDIREIRNSLDVIEAFVLDNDVKMIYMGDVLNRGYRLLAHIFYKRNIGIAFFEEGYSHYTGRYESWKKIFKDVLYAFILDGFIYYPRYHERLEYKVSVTDNNFNKIPQNVRYSLIPFYHESYDRLLKPTLLLSQVLQSYMEQELIKIKRAGGAGSLALFVNEEIKNFVKDVDAVIEEQLLKECVFHAVDAETLFLIKFHPAENVERRNQVKGMFDKNNIRYCILSEEINVPVEYYLQMLNFKRIFSYATAVTLYNGYLFPQTPTTRLLDDLVRICKEKQLPHLDKIEKLVNKLDFIQTSIKNGVNS